ncbi:MAG: iron-sulfur cluster repair protein YtfE [Bacteriovoracaceae bacterium]|nr:iron-sulfur cluster repair protein YtfE [Bacteriovoracaceae bacterium]
MQFADQPLSELAIKLPMATEIFRKNRLDFCCGGKQTLREACVKRNLDLNALVKQLEGLTPKDDPTFSEMPLDKMTFYIVDRYHNDLRRRFPELLALSQKVEQVHAEHSACPTGLFSLLSDMHNEMLMHMLKEENVLFPMIQNGAGHNAFMPIKVMNAEHESHGKQLEEAHRLTSDFVPPEGACGTWRALYAGLEKLEEEIMDHIHLENNILFPRALG